MSEQVFQFGSFELHLNKRQLLRSGKAVRLGSRALDILATLVLRAGEVVSKSELISAVWPNLFVEDGNLRVHITALRKALDDGSQPGGFISNLPGRGYSFVAPVVVSSAQRTLEFSQAAKPVHNLPPTIGKVVGRTKLVESLAALVLERRMISIVGPGGIGKTTVALEVAEVLLHERNLSVAFADLASLSAPSLVPGALASALGCAIRPQNPIESLIEDIGAREVLIILDSCEHLVGEVAHLAELLLARATGVRILATSREVLRTRGEWVQRLPALDIPSEAAALTPGQALQFSSIQLFVDRASDCLGGYALKDADVAFVVDICRRLDGIALAIELAAARVDAVGIRGLARALSDPAHLLSQGRRTGAQRHRTLYATLSWSYGILSEPERVVLRRAAVFNGGFTLAAARAVVAGPDVAERDVEDVVMNLVAKSLLIADAGTDVIQYRLLDTTRAYAWETLEREGEAVHFERCHAEYFRAFFEQVAADWEVQQTEEWLSLNAPQIGNLRKALDWAFSDRGQPDIGVALVVSAVPLWLQFSLIDECLSRVKQALASLEQQPTADLHKKMQLHAALGWPQMATVTAQGGTPSWRAALAIAEQIGDVDYQLRALWALWVDCKNGGLPLEGLELAERFRNRAIHSAEPSDYFIGERLRGASLHILGRHAEARTSIEHMLDHYLAPIHRPHTVRFQFDQRATARNTLARVLWMQGHSAESLREVAENIQHTIDIGHKLSLSNVLAEAACPVAFLIGDLDLCERYTARLRAETRAQALNVWNTYADCFSGELLIRRGHPAAGLAMLHPGIEKLRRANFVYHHTAFLAALAWGLTQAGHAGKGLTAIDEALEQCQRTGEGWFLPELHRLKGEIMQALNAGATEAAQAAFEQALGLARAQGALGWELRAATSFAKLLHRQGRLEQAREALAAVRAKFARDLKTPDLDSAADLLAAL